MGKGSTFFEKRILGTKQGWNEFGKNVEYIYIRHVRRCPVIGDAIDFQKYYLFLMKNEKVSFMISLIVSLFIGHPVGIIFDFRHIGTIVTHPIFYRQKILLIETFFQSRYSFSEYMYIYISDSFFIPF